MLERDARLKLNGLLAQCKYLAYREDPARFFREAVWIPSQRREERDRYGERFELFDYQEEDLQVFLEHSHVITLKARQLGMSTLVGGLLLWEAVFYSGFVGIWISNNQTNADKAIKMMDHMWRFLPEWLKARLPRKTSDHASKMEWQFEDGTESRIWSKAATATSGASETTSVVVLDEFALVNPQTQGSMYRSADPTTDAGGRMWILSTARGGYNMFAQIYRSAQKGIGRYVPIFHPWMVSRFVNPKADLLDSCTDCRGRGLIDGEYCDRCVDTSVLDAKSVDYESEPWLMNADYPATEDEAFRESGNPRFGGLPDLENCFKGWVRGHMRLTPGGAPYFEEDPEGPARLHEEWYAHDGPPPWREYAAYLDPSSGTGGDYTACIVVTWDEDDLPEIVGWWWANSVEPADAAPQIDAFCRWHSGHDGPPELAIETTGGWGDTYINELNRHLHYPRLYVHEQVDRRTRRIGTKLGFPLSWKSRPKVIDRLARYLQKDTFVGNVFPELRHELGTFVLNEKGRLEADVGCNDDLVIALAGALWVLVENTSATERAEDEGTSSDGTVTYDLSDTFERIENERRRLANETNEIQRRLERRMNRKIRRKERKRSRMLQGRG